MFNLICGFICKLKKLFFQNFSVTKLILIWQYFHETKFGNIFGFKCFAKQGKDLGCFRVSRKKIKKAKIKNPLHSR